MKPRNHHFAIGLFVLTGVGILVAFLIWVGSGRLNRDSIRVETYVEESVQGLDPGAALRFRGVKIGQVHSVALATRLYETEKPYVVIRIDVAQDAFREPIAEGDFARVFSSRVERGLRVRLAQQGITGLAYLEVDLLDAERFPPLPIDWEPTLPYIPSATSMTTRVSNSIEGVLENLSRVDLAGAVDEARTFVKELQRQIDAADIAGTTASYRTLAEDLRKSFTNVTAGLDAVVAKADRMLGSEATAGIPDAVRSLLADSASGVADLRKLLERAEATMSRVDETLTAGAEGAALIADLRRFVDRLDALAEDFRRRPSPLLFGDTTPRKDR